MSNAPSVAQLGQIVLLEAHFSHRGDPFELPSDSKHKPHHLSVEMSASLFDEDGACVVRMNLSSDPTEEGVLYDFAIGMAGILIRNDATPAEWGARDFAQMGVSMMYPFAREAVANITGRGRFGPVWLNPFNVKQACDAAASESEPEEPSQSESGRTTRET